MSALATILLVLGIIGVILPIVPGIPFLLAALVLFTVNSPGLRRRLLNSPRFARPFQRLDDWFSKPGADGLSSWERLKLKVLSTIEFLLPRSRR